MRLRLDSWYDGLSYRERVARMYAPAGDARAGQALHRPTPRATPTCSGQAINHYGVIGHAQTSARARRHGKPLIIRRDFNTVDGGQAGTAFRLRAAVDRGLRHDPQRDECVQRAAPEPGRSPTPSTTASTSSSSCSSAPTTSCRRAPTGRSRCCGRDYLGARSRLDRAPERDRWRSENESLSPKAPSSSGARSSAPRSVPTATAPARSPRPWSSDAQRDLVLLATETTDT